MRLRFNLRFRGLLCTFSLCLAPQLPICAPAAQGQTAQPTTLPARKAGVQNTKPDEPVATANEHDDIDVVEKPRGIRLDAGNTIRLNYGRGDWNRNSTKVDAAVIYLREGASGRVVQIEMEETAPDSAVFSGVYSINWRNLSALRVEFYAPPQHLLTDLQGRRAITRMIEARELRRLPYVLRRDPVTDVQNVELFDSAGQARQAYHAFQAEQELLVALQNRYAKRDQTIDTARLAMERTEFEEASKNLAERLRLSQLETQSISRLLQNFTQATPDERARRKKEAQDLADQAMTHYRAYRFAEARSMFVKAVELDPSNRTYYFQYGVTLYKLDDYNRALVYLDLADGKDVNAVERDFYRALSYYRLKDSVSALDAFNRVVDAKDPALTPSGRFYRGVIHFERKRWAEARPEFQAVLDESSDPALDEQAERYLEYILRQQRVETERGKRWNLSALVGTLYNDNVLLSSDSDRDRGVATGVDAVGTLFQGSLRYRALYEDVNEFAMQLDVFSMYSVGTDFQRTDSISGTDPTIVGFTAPWTHKGIVLGKGYKLDVTPGIETTFMSIEDNEWKSIYNSYLLGFQNLFVMNDRWYTNLNIDLRQDTSNLNSSTGDNDSTALKTRITWANMNFPFIDSKKIILSDVSYTLNNSIGKNSVFDRIDLGVGYVQPAFWNTTFSAKLNYFLLTYTENSSGRVDNNYSLNMGLSRQLSDKFMLGLSGGYNINNSNLTANQYKRMNLMLTLSTNEAF
ncbi:MAG: hypothetical protein RBT63_02955 [Bdellovibrionales bacterium]|jgi:tetratricopeptide (TPR) repeat protein|nr:hypothetical protein [Bdellovibrionales bacterium]